MTIEQSTDDLQARLAQLSPERRALLERKLRELAPPQTPRQEIPRRSTADPVPLTASQDLLWGLHQAMPDLVAYNVPRVLRIRGALDLGALQQALDALVARHETLRTRFVPTASGTKQVIAPESRVPLETIDLRNLPANERRAAAERAVVERTRRRFDLAADLMLRATAARIDDAEWVLLLLTHHMVCDEWSRDVTFRELGTFYAAFTAGTEAALPPLPIQYADYAVWQADAIERGALAPQLAYWREQLRGMATLDLPTDRPRGSVPRFGGARRRYAFSRELLDGLRTLARSHEATLQMTLLAAYNVVLSRHSGQDDIAVGSPISSRRSPELEGLIGFFPNALVLRTRLGDDPTFSDLLRRTREICLAAYEHQDVPLEKLALELRGAGQLGSSALFNVWFVMLAPDAAKLVIPGAEIEPLPSDFATAKFDILFGALETDDGLRVVLEYRTDLFDVETIDRFAEHLRNVLESAVAHPDARISDLPLLSSGERALVVRTWNDTATQYPSDATLVSLLAEQAAKTPNAVAVEDERRSLTYGELDSAATSLARRLRSASVGSGSLVGICAERSVELVVALVAIIKTGGAYVPLDPDYPADRLAFMLDDASVGALLTTASLAARLPALASVSARTLFIDDAADARDESRDPLPHVAPADAAYMIYTSGSTGRPKGALNAHRGIVNRLLWMQSEYRLGASDVVLQKTPFSFDVSVWEFFWPLITGARLVMARPGGHRDTGYLVDVITSRRVSVCHFVPSMLRAFLADPGVSRCVSLRDVMASGEALAPDLVSGFFAALPRTRLHNLYGPTECAVDVTYWPCPSAAAAPAVVPIGRPVANTQVYVLDGKHEPVPVGVPGELYLAGVQVGLGYHRRPELTAERFVRDPFSPEPNARMYRTGDKARWRSDGTLEYLGRLDFQVKVRGFRIELGEIESAMLQHPAVQDGVVAANDDGGGSSRLVAYIVPRSSDAQGDEDQAVGRWTEVFDRTYSNASDTGDAVESGFNIAGWISSYDKRPIPAAEMREWVDRTCERILALAPKRVLEIGCGTGLLLFRIAPRVEHFHGIDIAQTGLDAIAADPAFAPIADRVTLGQARADEIGSLAAGSFDTIIINSVAQYFPSADYFVQVIERAVRLLAPGGSIFLGDIRLLPLLEPLHLSVALYDAPDDLSMTDLRARVQQRLWHESELVIDPGFFDALRVHVPAISAVDVMIKRGAAANELTKFRGDVVLRIGGTTAERGTAISARTIDDVRAALRARPDALHIADVVDGRLARDARAYELVGRAPAQSTVREIRAALGAAMAGIDPEALATIDADYDVSLAWPASGVIGRFDVTLRRKNARLATADSARPVGHLRPWSEFVHHAAPEAFEPEQLASLREHLGATLPDYMIPSMFVRLNELPLTPSGKVDRKALRPPTVERGTSVFVEPRTETERKVAALWAELLGAERVGAEDRFLELGGHSLIAMRVVGRLRRELNVSIPLDPLLRGDTVAQVAALVDAALSAAQSTPAVASEPSLAPVARASYRRVAPGGGGNAGGAA